MAITAQEALYRAASTGVPTTESEGAPSPSSATAQAQLACLKAAVRACPQSATAWRAYAAWLHSQSVDQSKAEGHIGAAGLFAAGVGQDLLLLPEATGSLSETQQHWLRHAARADCRLLMAAGASHPAFIIPTQLRLLGLLSQHPAQLLASCEQDLLAVPAHLWLTVIPQLMSLLIHSSSLKLQAMLGWLLAAVEAISPAAVLVPVLVELQQCQLAGGALCKLISSYRCDCTLLGRAATWHLTVSAPACCPDQGMVIAGLGFLTGASPLSLSPAIANARYVALS